MEAGLTFLGLLVLQNALKPQSAAVIRQLHNADIRTVMVTGKNCLPLVLISTGLALGVESNYLNSKEGYQLKVKGLKQFLSYSSSIQSRT